VLAPHLRSARARRHDRDRQLPCNEPDAHCMDYFADWRSRAGRRRPPRSRTASRRLGEIDFDETRCQMFLRLERSA
jgi:hypothetical protein